MRITKKIAGLDLVVDIGVPALHAEGRKEIATTIDVSMKWGVVQRIQMVARVKPFLSVDVSLSRGAVKPIKRHPRKAISTL